MEQIKLDLTGLSRFVEGRRSVDREAIPDGSYSPESLLVLLLDGWIPYWECHKCGRFESCLYVIRSRSNPELARDIQCGVAAQALRNFLEVSWSQLFKFDQEQKQNFFDGLYHWTQYVFTAEIDVGFYASKPLVRGRGEDSSRRVMSYISIVRRHLDDFAFYFKGLPGFAEPAIWVLVEGESEKAFLERLIALRSIDFHVLGVETYRGKGNARPKQLHLEHLLARGLQPMLQADRDNGSRLERTGMLEVVETAGGVLFAFQPDFESVFPARVLHRALERDGFNVSLEWLEGLAARGVGKVVTNIEQRTGKNLSKIRLASTLADVVHASWHLMYNDWPDNPITKWIEYLKYGSVSTRNAESDPS